MLFYFSLFEKGQKIREIEVCYSEEFDSINYGEKFEFESDQPDNIEEAETDYYFGFEELEHYCRQFGLDIQTDYNHVDWTILKNGNIKKQWWKFW